MLKIVTNSQASESPTLVTTSANSDSSLGSDLLQNAQDGLKTSDDALEFLDIFFAIIKHGDKKGSKIYSLLSTGAQSKMERDEFISSLNSDWKFKDSEILHCSFSVNDTGTKKAMVVVKGRESVSSKGESVASYWFILVNSNEKGWRLETFPFSAGSGIDMSIRYPQFFVGD